MKLIAKGVQVNLKLEDKITGALYANCPVDTYPGKMKKKYSIIVIIWMQSTLCEYGDDDDNDDNNDDDDDLQNP